MADIDIVVSAVDQATSIFEQIASVGEDTANFLGNNWLKVGATLAAVGGALEASNRRLQTVRANVYQFAQWLGITKDQANALVRASSDVTMGLEETVEVMRTGVRQGLRDVNKLKEYAAFWNKISTASLESAASLAKAGKSLAALGIGVRNITDALPAFEYLLASTDISLEMFLRTAGRSARELQAMRLSALDLALIMGYLEDKGFSEPRIMLMTLRRAMRESGGDLEAFLSGVGLTTQGLEELRKKAESTKGSIQELAKAHEDSFSLMQRLSQQFSEFRLKYEGLFQILADMVNAFLLLWLAGKMVAKVLSVLASTAIVKGIIASFAAIKAAILPVVAVVLSLIAAIKFLQWLTKGARKTLFPAAKEIKEMEDWRERAFKAIKLLPKEDERRKQLLRAIYVHEKLPIEYREMVRQIERERAPKEQKVVHEHSGTIRIEGVSDTKDFKKVVNVIVDELQKQTRRTVLTM